MRDVIETTIGSGEYAVIIVAYLPRCWLEFECCQLQIKLGSFRKKHVIFWIYRS